MKNKNSAAALAFFLGWAGGHKFYLGEVGWGIIYAIFFWTNIPAVAGFVEFILLLSMQKPEFDRKYNSAALAGYESRQLINSSSLPIQVPPQVIVNIGSDKSVSASYESSQDFPELDPNVASQVLANEKIDRRILKLCQNQGEITLLDCFLEIEDVPRSILESRLESLVRQEFLQIGNRASDGKIVYSLDN
ncbi:MAG: TM2 domain-containing protein [Limnothrix sp. RL_2_0]|nr:TM2 domain-containing protein [Limnothrix sp. RL_2_0]